jgi:RHS repeat-associated protein
MRDGNTLFDQKVDPNHKNRFPDFTYDENGSVTEAGEFYYSYDSRNRLRQSTDGIPHQNWHTEYYLYGTEANRIRRVSGFGVPITILIFNYYLRSSSGNVLTEYTEGIPSPPTSFRRDKDYIYFGGQLVSQLNSTGPNPILHFHPDHLGTPRVITDDIGNVVSNHDYWPFGYEITDPGYDISTHKFTGHDRDSLTGLDYMLARYYGNYLGKFYSVDPVGGNVKSSQSWNGYEYALNNPARYNDPSGEACNEVVDKIDQVINDFVDFVDGNTNEGPVSTTINDVAVGVGSVLSGFADMLRVGDAVGTAIGSGGDSYDVGLALSQDVSRSSALFVTLAPVVAPIGNATLTTKVVHFTDDAGVAGISESGALRSSTFVTRASEVRGLSAAEVENKLEISAGKSANFIEFRTPKWNLKVPENGPVTSGGAWQRVIKRPAGVDPRGFGQPPI